MRSKAWIEIMASDLSFASALQLDPLILSQDMTVRKVAVTMGALIMTKVPGIRLEEIVSDEFSMNKIN
jgi:hypothetical protein